MTSWFEIITDAMLSRRIEGESTDCGTYAMRRHIMAHMEVACNSRIYSVEELHQLLFDGVYEHAGKLRQVEACVQNFQTGEVIAQLPHARFIPELMEEFAEKVLDAMTDLPPNITSEAADMTLFAFYCHFLCIHPFEDGNGRVGRLLLNMLRLQWGLPWRVTDTTQHEKDLQLLRSFEEYVFHFEHKNKY